MDKGGRSSWAVVLALSLAELTACTPAATSELEWAVANDTEKALVVTVRYALDSTLLAMPEDLAWVRQQWWQDSVVLRSRGENYQPIEWLVHHQTQSFFVYSRVPGAILVQNDKATNSVSFAQVSLSRGLVTLRYTLPAHSNQILFLEGYFFSLGRSASPPMTELWLEQGGDRRRVLPDLPLDEVFEEERTGREYGNNSVHRIQLTVGSKLSINPTLFYRLWRRLSNGIRVNGK